MVVITFSASIVNLLLDLALVPIAGIMGAAFATLCSYACIGTAYCALIRGRFTLGIEKITVFLGISILHIAGLLVFRNPVAAVAITLAAGGAFFLAGKSMSVFSAEDQGIYESLRMPVFAKRALLRICGYHG
jgi:O-antigen/teichoic acid export membrane protein